MTSRQIKINETYHSQPHQELLQVADAVAREKGIEKEEVIEAMEEAILKASRSKYGFDHDIHVTMDRLTGSVTIQKHILVVGNESKENEYTQITLEDAKSDPKTSSAEEGDVIVFELPPIEFGRVAAQSARQVIMQKMRDAERLRLVEEYKDKVGQIITAVVKRVEFGNVVLEIGRGEAMLRRDQTIQRETFQNGERIRVFVTEVNSMARGPIVSVSRTHPGFMAKLFEQEVPEIYDGVIEIKSIARDPGSRAKMAVYTPDQSIDPVGSCVGMRGSRVQAVVQELQGEKVDIIPWSSNPATFVVNALAPAEVSKVVLDEEAGRVDVVVPEDQLSLAIGRRGQNVRLASQLTGWSIDILTEAQEMERRSQDYAVATKLFMGALNVDEMIAQLLAAENFISVEEIAEVEHEEFASIEGFDEDIATELQNRARTYLEGQTKIHMSEAISHGAQDDLMNLEGMEPKILAALTRNGVKNLNDFADLSGDEVLEMVGGDAITLDYANALIMKAREPWFKEE